MVCAPLEPALPQENKRLLSLLKVMNVTLAWLGDLQSSPAPVSHGLVARCHPAHHALAGWLRPVDWASAAEARHSDAAATSLWAWTPGFSKPKDVIKIAEHLLEAVQIGGIRGVPLPSSVVPF